ncbi:MAG: sulfate transporter ATP-binding protein [Sphingomonas bacterium]|nr:sulfate transporter ATP-binding protein [Sphingomonas bacterium]
MTDPAALFARTVPAAAGGGAITLESVDKSYGAFRALDSVSLEVRAGEFLALLGPSGSGKTTLLRIVAGLDSADGGIVRFGDEDVGRRGPAERGVGFVFQHYALFGHMRVAENVAFGLRVRPRAVRPSDAEIDRRVAELIDLVQLGGLGDRYPAQLSGGQRQRVALARALAVEPRILLLDEPFGALDAKVRKELRGWLRALHDRTGLTSIFVTHDQDEALELADRVAVMAQGRIVQVADPRTLYEEPASAFVFEFVGESNRLSVMVRDGCVQLHGREIEVGAIARGDGPASLYFRPHDVSLAVPGGGTIPAIVTGVRMLGGKTRIEAAAVEGGEALILDVTGTPPRRGEQIALRLGRARLFQDGGR